MQYYEYPRTTLLHLAPKVGALTKEQHVHCTQISVNVVYTQTQAITGKRQSLKPHRNREKETYATFLERAKLNKEPLEQ